MGAETELALLTHAKKMNEKFREETEVFPAGLRVLAVDDDRVCLLILGKMLQQCHYKVTTCERAADALKILRENKDGFDVVISDVHMPDMDGFKLLELVGLEMDLPVIMLSANGETNAVMKGIKHGACDYLLKPVRIEELKVIWQHVVRKRKDDGRNRVNDGGDNHGSDSFKCSKKRKDALEEEDDAEVENEDPSSSKKQRVVWSVDLHQKFVSAVDQLGIDKAVPKRILELMDVRGLTRENVASHLQKYRLYLKRLSGPPHQQTNFGSMDERYLGVGDFQTHFPTQAMASSLHTGLLDRKSSKNHLLGQVAALHGPNNSISVGKIPHGLLNSSTINVGQLALFDKSHNNRLPSISKASGQTANDGVMLAHTNNHLMMQMLQQQNSSQISGGMLSDTDASGQKILSGRMSSLTPSQVTINAPPPHLGSCCELASTVAPNSSRVYHSSSDIGVYNIPMTSNILATSISHGNEISINIPGQNHLLYDSNLQAASSNSILSTRLGSGLDNWQEWNDTGYNQPCGQRITSISNSQYIQNLPLSDNPAMEVGGGLLEKGSNWAVDLKPQVNGLSGSFSAAAIDDLLSSYINQQQHEVMGLSERDLVAQGYALDNNNMYAK